MLEETALPYTVQLVDIEKGEQMRPEFLALARIGCSTSR